MSLSMAWPVRKSLWRGVWRLLRGVFVKPVVEERAAAEPVKLLPDQLILLPPEPVKLLSYQPVLLLPAPKLKEVQVLEGEESQPSHGGKHFDLSRPGNDTSFYFRESILESLDKYFVYLERMKKSDREAYNLYRKVGASIFPKNMTMITRLGPWWQAGNRPAFGCVAPLIQKGQDEKDLARDMITPKFVYFQKLVRPPSDVQKGCGTVYRVVSYFDSTLDGLPYGVPLEHWISLDDQCNIKLLKVRKRKCRQIWSKRHKQTISIPNETWSYGTHIKPWYNEHKLNGDGSCKTIDQWAATNFALMASAYEGINSDTNVRVTKSGLTAIFAIFIKRTPYFFSDRDVQVTHNGRKARIFHIVRPHRRKLKDGKEIYIKMHHRGIRQFMWNGYQINISVPGLHHMLTSEFDVGALDFDSDHQRKQFEINNPMMDMKELGTRLKEHFDTGGPIRLDSAAKLH